MVLAAEQVARHKTGTHKRLPLSFYAILDELRFGVRLPTLPYISNVLRKFGIDYSRPGNGICHYVHIERYAKPGGILVGADSHTTTSGALPAGALGGS